MPKSASSIFILGDIGGWETYHAGDEAMMEANIDGLRKLRPDVGITAASFDPAWTAAHYGIQSTPPIGFWDCKNETEMQRLWTDVMQSGAIAIDAIAAADAVIISGGGNLRSQWPPHIYDRMAALRVARSFGKPAIVLGQTVGPDLTAHHRNLMATTLKVADLIGLREADSSALVRSLGISPGVILDQLDDAWFLGVDPPVQQDLNLNFLNRPWIAVTFSSFDAWTRDSTIVHSIATQLSAIARESGATLVFIPHWMERPGYAADATIAREFNPPFGPSEPSHFAPCLSRQDCRLDYAASRFGDFQPLPCARFWALGRGSMSWDLWRRIHAHPACRRAWPREYAEVRHPV